MCSLHMKPIRIARMTPGTSGADLGTIVNEAAIRTVRRQAEVVCAEDFGEALKSFYSTRSINMAGMLIDDFR